MSSAWRSWTAVLSLSGFIWTIVTTGVLSLMNSPTCTRRSLIAPPTGALITASWQLLLSEFDRRPTILQGGFQALDRLQSGLVCRLRNLDPGLDRIEISLRDELLAHQHPGARKLGPGVVPIGDRCPDHGNLLVRRRFLEF